MDKKSTGEVLVKDLITAIQDCGYLDSAKDIQKLIKRYNAEPNSSIKYSDFIASAVDARNHISADDLWAVFNHFDTQGLGRITSTDLVNVFSRSGKDVSRPEVRAMLEEAVQEGPFLDFERFEKMMRQSASIILTRQGESIIEDETEKN